MSLLMDALKKAEAAKQAQAGEEAEAQKAEGEEEIEFSLEMEPVPEEPAAQPAPESESKADAETADDGFSLSLDDTQVMPSAADVQQQREDEAKAETPPPIFPPGPDDLGFDDTTTMPSMRSVQRSVDAYFDGTQPDMEAVRPEEPAEERSHDFATTVQKPMDTQLRKAARRVLAAKTAPKSPAARWAIFAGVPAFLLALAAGSFFAWKSFVSPPELKPLPRLAEQPPVVVPETSVAPEVLPDLPGAPSPAAEPPGVEIAMAPAEPAPSAPAATAAPAESLPESAVPSSVSGRMTLEEEPPVADLQQPAPGGQQVAPRPEQPAITETAPAVADQRPAESSEQPAVSEEPQLAQAVEPQSTWGTPAPAETFRPGAIQIARQRQPDRVHRSLRDAYGAFQRGDDAAAAAAYQRVLEAEPRNRDAVMGLAAIAVRERQWDKAAELYLELIALDPRDSVAQAALLSMQGNLDPVASESRIKLLLEKEPEAAHLHFSLGNFYAAQSRWAEAESAYFGAYQADADNADYAFNLAVSLDHLAQREAALNYYRRALELAAARPASFAVASVQERIRTMSEGLTQ